ncbi:MAG: 3-methyl-2-oxobutanoate hydroxymethyltransferase [Planctomycetota bacterium]
MTGISVKRLGLNDFRRFKREQHRFTVLTAYDAPTARILEAQQVPMLLVGDSLGNVVLGHRDTVPVTMADMLHHARAVRRGAPDTFIVGDMPFLSYQVSLTAAIENAGLFLKDAGMDAVKLEGGAERADCIRGLVSAGIAVMGHLGLTPQSATLLGGYKVQATTVADANRLLADARALEAAGVFAIVLECVPAEVARRVTEAVAVPTIGIGAGPHCDAQVLVLHDLLGFGGGGGSNAASHRPKFVRTYANLDASIGTAVRQFQDDVAAGTFPAAAESFHLSAEEQRKFGEKNSDAAAGDGDKTSPLASSRAARRRSS